MLVTQGFDCGVPGMATFLPFPPSSVLGGGTEGKVCRCAGSHLCLFSLSLKGADKLWPGGGADCGTNTGLMGIRKCRVAWKQGAITAPW